MNQELFFGLLIGAMFLSSISLGQFLAAGQDKTNKDPGITYAQTARQLLNQSRVEYSAGNTTGAEELATRAYLDNFEYIEPALEQKGVADLKEQIEGMMREEVRDLIMTNASVEELDTLINATDAKLVKAISILNGTGD